MNQKLTRESETLFVVRLDGILVYSDLKEFEDKFSSEIDRKLKTNVLILAERFSGWGKEGDWGDLTFMYDHDEYIRKIAVVADNKWKEQFMMFLGEGRRNAEVRFYCQGEEQDARNWLEK